MTEDKRNVPAVVFTSTLGWCVGYYMIEEVTGRSPEWSCRLITAVHALVITSLASLDWLVISPWTIDKLGEDNSYYQQQVLSITLGYFIFDMLWVVVHQTEGYVMYCHHLASIACLTLILFNGSSGSEALLGISGLELTNPCLQARWFLRTHGYQGRLIHTLTEIIFMVTFLLFRVVYGTRLVYHIAIHPKPYSLIKYTSVLLYIISWAFLIQMTHYICKKYTRTAQVDKLKK